MQLDRSLLLSLARHLVESHNFHPSGERPADLRAKMAALSGSVRPVEEFAEWLHRCPEAQEWLRSQFHVATASISQPPAASGGLLRQAAASGTLMESTLPGPLPGEPAGVTAQTCPANAPGSPTIDARQKPPGNPPNAAQQAAALTQAMAIHFRVKLDDDKGKGARVVVVKLEEVLGPHLLKVRELGLGSLGAAFVLGTDKIMPEDKARVAGMIRQQKGYEQALIWESDRASADDASVSPSVSSIAEQCPESPTNNSNDLKSATTPAPT